MQTEVKITISVITKIGYLSGALEVHYDSSHFYEHIQVAKTLEHSRILKSDKES